MISVSGCLCSPPSQRVILPERSPSTYLSHEFRSINQHRSVCNESGCILQAVAVILKALLQHFPIQYVGCLPYHVVDTWQGPVMRHVIEMFFSRMKSSDINTNFLSIAQKVLSLIIREFALPRCSLSSMLHILTILLNHGRRRPIIQTLPKLPPCFSRERSEYLSRRSCSGVALVRIG